MLLLEDLGDYEVGDQIIGATLAQTEIAIDELSKLHAAFWNKVDDIEWIPHVSNSYHATNLRNFAVSGWDNMLSVFGKFIPQHIVIYSQLAILRETSSGILRMKCPNCNSQMFITDETVKLLGLPSKWSHTRSKIVAMP